MLMLRRRVSLRAAGRDCRTQRVGLAVELSK